MVLQNYQNLIEMTSNMIYIVALGVGFKCPRKIHLNTQCTLHIRVVLSKKLELHFLFLICSLGYKNKEISSKKCFLNIENFLEEVV